MGVPVTLSRSSLNFGAVAPNSSGPVVPPVGDVSALDVGTHISNAPVDAQVSVSLDQPTPYFKIVSFDVYEWTWERLDPGELPPGHHGPPPKVRVLELTQHSDGSDVLAVTAGQVVSVIVEYHAPADGADFHGTLLINGSTWDTPPVPLSFFIAGVVTTVLTPTPLILTRGDRGVKVLLQVRVVAGPDTPVSYSHSVTQLSSGVNFPNVMTQASHAPAFVVLSLDVDDNAPLGYNELAVTQIDWKPNGFLIPMTIVATALSPWEFVGPQNYGLIESGGSPVSGRVNALAYDRKQRGTWYLGAAMGGVWKTTDFGNNWTPLTDGWKVLPVNSVAVDPNDSNIVYAGTGDVPLSSFAMGVMKSSDGGASWKQLGASQIGDANVSRVLVSAKSSSDIWVSVFDGFGHVWHSTDGGESWAPMTALPPTSWLGIEQAALGPNDRYYAVGEGIGGELWRTDNGGSSWTKLVTPLRTTMKNQPLIQQRPIIACSPIFADNVYLFAPTDQRIYRSKDAGKTWDDITDNWNDWGAPLPYYTFCIACSYTGGPTAGNAVDVIYVGQATTYRSAQGGGNWQPVEGNTFGHADQHAIAVNPFDPNSVLVGNDGGAFDTTFINPATVVLSVNRTLAITQIYRAAYSEDLPTRILAGAQDVGTASTSGDFAGWTMVGGGDGGGCAINPRNSDVQYLQSNFSDAKQIELRRTTNNWQTSDEIAHPLMAQETRSSNAPMVVDPNNPLFLYVATNFLYRWVEPGAQEGGWQDHLGNQQLSSTGQVEAIAIAASDNQRLYTGSSDNELWMSTDIGRTWRRIDSGLPSSGSITSVSVHPQNPDDVLVTIGGPKLIGGLWHCPNASADQIAWTDVSNHGQPNGLPEFWKKVVVRHPVNPERIWYVGTDVGLFFTDDAGQHWYNYTWSRGLPNVKITDLKVVKSSGHLYAATYGRGIWRTKL